MKHKILLVLFLSLMACFTANAQKVTLQFRQVKLAKVFDAITQQTGLTVAYSRPTVDPDRVVSIEADKEELSDVLTQLLKGTNVIFEIGETKIYLKEEPVSDTPQKNGRLITISGTIVDEKGETIIGASVAVQGTTLGTITNANGEYSLANVPENSKITISFIGYQSISLPASTKMLSKVVMKEDNEVLDEVVVVGYGTQSKTRTTGAIAQIKQDKIANIPVSSFEQAIAGQLPGVQVMQQSGAPGAGASMKIRGSSSITAGTNPLIVIDGFPMTSENTASLLNPEDIESIDVLKDASSSAIYGSRGANGVIVITTKKGKDGKARISAKAYYGIQTVSKKIDLMDAYEYADFVVAARNNYWVDLKPGVNTPEDPNSVRPSKARIPDYLAPYLNKEAGLVNTNWQDELFRTAAIQQYDLSVSGGNEKISYYTSISYANQDGVIKNSGFKRLSARSNISAKLNKHVSFDFDIAPSYSVTNKVSESNHKADGVVLMTMLANPAAMAYNLDGSIKYGDQIEKGQAWGTAALESPLATAMSIKDDEKTFNILSNLNLNITILDNLKFKSHFGVQYNKIENDYFRPSYLAGYNSKAPSKAVGKYFGYTTLNWITENTLTYSLELNDHYIEFLAGISAQREDYDRAKMVASDFPNDNITTLNAGIVNSGYTDKSTWTLFSYFARVNYSYKNKYLLAASIRRDGSSRFGKNNKYGTFPSVSIGWRIIEEEWMKKLDILSDLKLRASVGGTGNFQISNYSSYSLLNPANYLYSNVVVNGLAPSTAPNPNISWEKTTQWNVGLDVGLFNNRLTFAVDYYKSTTDGLLLNVPVPAASGFTTSLQNIGKVNNKGVELSIKADIGNDDFMWSPSLNFSKNKSKVIRLGPGQTQILQDNSLTKVGGEVGSYYVYNVIGIYKSEEDLNKYPHLSTSKVGSYIYEDISGPDGKPDGKITDADRKVMGNYMPDFTMGFYNSFSFKNFDLSFMIQWVQGVDIFNKSNAFLLNEEGWGTGAKKLYNNWFSENNLTAKYARPLVSPTDKLYESSNYMLEDGSYLRFNNITLGYRLPKKILNKMNVGDLRFYVTAHNPFTITSYSGYNPEVSMSSNPLTPGIDYGGYPVNKSIVFGINVNF